MARLLCVGNISVPLMMPAEGLWLKARLCMPALEQDLMGENSWLPSGCTARDCTKTDAHKTRKMFDIGW